jgi:mono/diheme cytochrome c family protein
MAAITVQGVGMRSPIVTLTLLAACAAEAPPPETSRVVPGRTIVAIPTPPAPPAPESPPTMPESPPTMPESSPTPPLGHDLEPAAIIGGTLLPLHEAPGNVVVVGDPDGHRVFVVDLEARAVRRTYTVDAAPRRLAELPDGRVLVTLARGGLLVLASAAADAPEATRLEVCGLPRGVAVDAAHQRVLIACREGALVVLDARTLREERRLTLPRDLRDVVVSGSTTYVTRFKTAEVLVLDEALSVRATARLPIQQGDFKLTPAVAWRAVAGDHDDLWVVHQQGRTDLGLEQQAASMTTTQLGYGGQVIVTQGGPPCARPVVTPALSRVGPDGAVTTGPVLARGTLMVDAALHDRTLLLADAGVHARSQGSPLRQLALDELRMDGEAARGASPAGCAGTFDEAGDDTVVEPLLRQVGEGLVTAVSFDRRGQPVALVGAPLTLITKRGPVAVGPQEFTGRGQRLFHQDAALGVACASCHPEGEDDGLVWNLPEPRRTPALGGGLLDSAPYHWLGDLRDLPALYTEVFEGRMGGPPLSRADAAALTDWLDALPSIDAPPVVDVDAVERGARIAARSSQGCQSCHFGRARQESMDVGTGRRFQPPSLRGLAFRAPYLHDGCAPTLADRFGRCATRGHGATEHLTARELDDLIAYLESL